MKRPSFQFYPADWRKDAALQSCSMAAQGLWINMICIAHECDPYGHLVINGHPMSCEQIARLVGLPGKECKRYLDELISTGVVAITDEGVYFSRRMVKDEEVREKRAENGKAGSEFGHLGAEHGKKGGRPRKDEGGKKPPKETPQATPHKPPPSSSSSSSSSEGVFELADSGPPDTPNVVKLEADKPVTAEAWEAYREAFVRRYRCEPARNQMVNAQLAGLVKRLGAENAPKVAAFYVDSDNRFYADRKHTVALLLKDAEKLHTEWLTAGQQSQPRFIGLR